MDSETMNEEEYACIDAEGNEYPDHIDNGWHCCWRCDAELI